MEGKTGLKTIKIYQVDSFTTEKFKGNPAGVVLNADALTEREMLKIARELNNSETAFVLSPDSDDHDVRLRYFTPQVEVPVCGHATIAAHYVRALEYKLDTSTIIHKIKIGVLPVEILKSGTDYSIMMTQGSIEFYPPLGMQEREEILKAMDISEDELDQQCPIQIVSTGHSKVIIGIKTRKKLDSLAPNMHVLAQMSKVINCNGYFVFTMDSQETEILTHGRMFAPAIGVNEDPVTGNANGPLGAYLVEHGLVKPSGSEFSFKAEQGTAIGRSGIVEVIVKLIDSKPEQVKVGGKAVIVFKTEIEI